MLTINQICWKCAEEKANYEPGAEEGDESSGGGSNDSDEESDDDVSRSNSLQVHHYSH